jgi:hypothetical protein
MLGGGGPGNSGDSRTTSIPGTTSGNYQVVVTGTSGALKVSTTIPLFAQ